MNENKENNVGTNFSSGAEKVEEIAANTPTAGVNSTMGGGYVSEEQTESAKVRMLREKRKERERKAERERQKAERERDAAARRVSEAMKRQERKENIARRKAEERRLAELKREKRAQDKQNKKKSNDEFNKSGWIAAVAVLGAITLGLGAVVTVGAIEMKDTKQGITNAYRGDLYELTGLVENVDGDLDRLRVSASKEQQARLLTDLLVQVRLAEGVLEKLPVPSEADGNVTSFLNKTAMESERLLTKLRRGETLNKQDDEELERLYRVNHQVRGILDGLANELQDEDLLEYLKGKGEDMMTEALRGVENATIEENRNPSFATPPEVRAGAMPKDDKREKISSSEAETLAREYFSEYKIQNIEFQGETIARRLEAYNFMLTDENDVTLFAQLSQTDGALVSFDYYEYCTEHNFDLDNAKTIAENFLEKMGLEDMTAVKVGQMGTTASFTFAYEMDDVVYYPDTVEVKVCEEKGVVVGYNASAYLKHHKEREAIAPKISMSEAAAKLHEKLSLTGSRVALVKAGREERIAYEFICEYNDQTYFVYIDGTTGEEISIINANDLIR